MTAPVGSHMILRWLAWFGVFLAAGMAGIAAIRLVRHEPIDAAVFVSRLPMLLIIAGVLLGFQVARDLKAHK